MIDRDLPLWTVGHWGLSISSHLEKQVHVRLHELEVRLFLQQLREEGQHVPKLGKVVLHTERAYLQINTAQAHGFQG